MPLPWREQSTCDRSVLNAWWAQWPDALPAIDLAKAGLLVIDGDRHGAGPDGVASWAAICAENGWAGVAQPIVDTSGNGEHVYFRQRDGKPLGNSEGDITGLGINVRGHGGYVIAPGAMLPDGRRWLVRKGAPSIVEAFAHNRDAIPVIPDWLVSKLNTRTRKASETPQPKGVAGPRERAYAATALDQNAAELAAAKEGGRNNKLNAIAYRMGTMIGAGWIERAVVERALEGACVVNGLGQTYDDYACGGAGEVDATMRSGIEAGIAEPIEPLPPDESAIKYYEDPSGAPDGSATVAPRYSDEALALAFAAKHQHDFRYVAAWSQWMSWTGTHWRKDGTLRAREAARRICRDAAAECSKPSEARKLASGKTVGSVEALAKADRRLAAASDQWDSDLWLLNTPGGIIDLRTGECRAARPDDYMTKIAAAAPNGSGCPLFLKFLDTICGGDVELIAYLQRVFGYALTGDTSEHALFFGYGAGANGKSVLLSTIAGILGDYHTTAPIETFTFTNFDRHSTEIADLRGARLVTATETEEGRRWAESRIKLLTGGEQVSARFMRQDSFKFTPQLKLFIAGNHKPSLRSVTEATKRRFNLIPFAVTIPSELRDKALAEKLKAEWAGILQWMIEGCLNWQRLGLSPPKVVRTATSDYFAEEDAIANWIDDCCDRVADHWEPLSADCVEKLDVAARHGS